MGTHEGIRQMGHHARREGPDGGRPDGASRQERRARWGQAPSLHVEMGLAPIWPAPIWPAPIWLAPIWPFNLLVCLHTLDVGTVAHQFGGNESRILSSQCLATCRRTQHMLLPFAATAIGGMQDILGNRGHLARHTVKTGEIVDIDQDQPLRRLQYIDAIEVKAKDLPHAPRQPEHLARNRYLLLLYCAMQGRGFGDGMHLLARDVKLDIVTCVLYIAHRQVVSIVIELEFRHLLRRMHQVNILQGCSIARLHDNRIHLMRNLRQRARMADEIRQRDGQSLRCGISSRNGLIAHQADSARIVDRWYADGFGGFQNREAGTIGYGFQHIGVIIRQREVRQAGHSGIRLQYVDLMPPLLQLVGEDHWHWLAFISLFQDKAEAHPCPPQIYINKSGSSDCAPVYSSRLQMAMRLLTKKLCPAICPRFLLS